MSKLRIPTKQELIELNKSFNFTDTNNNRLELVENKLYLYPNKSLRSRNIGYLLISEKGLIYVKNEKQSGLHLATNSWSVYNEILKRVFGVMIVDEKGGKYKITKKKAYEEGKFLHFKNSTEKKVYINLNSFHYEKPYYSYQRN